MVVDRARKTEWAARHKKPKAQGKAQSAARQSAKLLAGLERKGEGSITWSAADMDIDWAWKATTWVPFTYGLSKNAVWSMAGGGGHMFMRKKAAAARAEITTAVKRAMAGRQAVEAKVYIEIFVQKSNQRGDAINVVDVVCDGIKDALGIDDRWFCIRGLDWEVVKANPRIFIGVSQEAEEHHRVCSYCGAIKPHSEFGKNKAVAHGVSRMCKTCSAPTRKPKNDPRTEVRVVRLGAEGAR
jgi:Holliday junction resolvase RusA-like endonuclease